MKNFFKKYNQVVLATAAFVLLAVVAVSFAWGIFDLSDQIDHAVIFEPDSQSSVSFNITGAMHLDLKGLVQQ
jgi:hypothetical protein